MFGFNTTEKEIPSDYVCRIVHKKMRGMVQRGLRMTKISDNQVLFEDIDEWLCSDSTKLMTLSKYTIKYDIYASSNTAKSLGGLVICVNIHDDTLLWYIFNMFINVIVCCVTILWLFVYAQALSTKGPLQDTFLPLNAMCKNIQT